MFRLRFVTFVGLTAVLFCGVTLAITYAIGLETQQLKEHGIEAQASVTKLRIIESRSGNSRTKHHRVWAEVKTNESIVELQDDVHSNKWKSLSKGDFVDVIYVPSDPETCLVGDRSDLEATIQRSKLFRRVAIVGLPAGLAILFVHFIIKSIGLGNALTQSNGESVRFGRPRAF